MLEPPEDHAKLKGYIRKANANSDEKLIKIINDHKHKASCFCSTSGCIGSFLPLTACFFWKVIPPDQYAIVSHSGFAELMFDGTHRMHSCRQHVHRRPRRSDTYIRFRDMHIITIASGCVGLARDRKRPIFLGEGRHCYFNPQLEFDESRVVNLHDSFISHGPIHILSVGVGTLAYGLQTNLRHPRILSPGLHFIDDERFKFCGEINLNLPQQMIGAMQLVRVETGDVGIAYRSGALSILEPGLHLIVPPDRFEGLLSVQQTVVSLPEAVHESGDYVPLRIRADVFYSVADPMLALTVVDDIRHIVTETASDTLASIIRASTLQDIARSSKPTFTAAEKPPAGAGDSFYTFVHDQFISELHDDCLRKWGIELQNIRIESIKIDNASLSEQISKQSLIYATTQARLSNLQSSCLIKETEAMRDGVIAVKKAEAEKASAELMAEAEAARLQLDAKANADALEIDAKAYAEAKQISSVSIADATVISATAQRNQLALVGEGSRVFAMNLEKTQTATKLHALRIQSSALHGVSKEFFAGDIPPGFITGLGTGVPPI